jgi:hypothetical protein
MATKIKPTVGRVVHYRPSRDDGIPSGAQQPLVALIAYVHSDNCVNLSIFDMNGQGPYARTSVPLVQDGEPAPTIGFASWMPYQVGQAAKTEQLEKELAGAGDVADADQEQGAAAQTDTPG